jgi:hypothetical protein
MRGSRVAEAASFGRPHSNGGHEFGPEIRTKRTTHRTNSVTGAPDPVRGAPDWVKLRHGIEPNSNRGDGETDVRPTRSPQADD